MQIFTNLLWPDHNIYTLVIRSQPRSPYSKVILESLPLRILLFPKVVSDPLILSLHSPKFIYPDKQTRMSPDISTWLSHQPLKPNIVHISGFSWKPRWSINLGATVPRGKVSTKLKNMLLVCHGPTISYSMTSITASPKHTLLLFTGPQQHLNLQLFNADVS